MKKVADEGEIVLNEETYKDKVLGCWLGKNAGGTLGEPLEARFGREEPFQVSWYPELPEEEEEGLPNDDLEIQLIWLQALQEKGPALEAADLAEYWLDHIVYNFDEYGLHKTNLNKGLAPPVSGWYNNWFKDCMGSPIRSEIWACVAPGAPSIAAKYAFQDAICDHAGGESVYGEIFNATVQSAAFLFDEALDLIEVGLSAIPADSETYGAISRAVDLYRDGKGWREARDAVMEEFFHPVAQYSPINLGFQTIGWLYGEDFGDALCKAVNCGWDTDCTGATLGAILGIVYGGKNLPEKWLEPLGMEIVTNARRGGLRNLTAPTDVRGLTKEVCQAGKRVLDYWGTEVAVGEGENKKTLSKERIRPDTSSLLDYSPKTLHYDLSSLRVSVVYGDGPAVVGPEETELGLEIENVRAERLDFEVEIIPPSGWEVKEKNTRRLELDPADSRRLNYSFSAPPDSIELSNRGTVRIEVSDRPAPLRLPLVFAGGFRWAVSSPFKGKNLEDELGLEEESTFSAPPEDWREEWRKGNDLRPEEFFEGESGVVYLLHWIRSTEEKEVVLGVPNNNRMKFWLNGEFLKETEEVVSLAPNEGGDGSNYAKAKLQEGWNQVLIKLERGNEPVEAHFLVSGIDREHPINDGRGLTDLVRSRFP